ncbi:MULTISPECIES: phospholipase D-like domain-containing protein [Actinomadura]|uniref:Phosphatidylserine/phosphatidylglycerophosphate/ cardiolipin synthase family protein n=1 Tax=Actinomadura yumaensis TaxID=111807 RepID=A0ABW2CT58_9ACTN|nr:phospholipase D family protein [Actinomadura sp. J1-007]
MHRPPDIDAVIGSACGDDPVAAGTARRLLARLAAASRPGPLPDRAARALVAAGLLRRAGDGAYSFTDERARACLAEMWRTRGPAALTAFPLATDLASGWAVAQGPAPTTGNAVEFLIDNEAAWGRLAEDVRAARSSVRAMLFMLDVPHVRVAFGRDPMGNPGPAEAVRLEDELLGAARRGADVRLVLNHVTPPVSPANTSWPLERYFRENDPDGLVGLRRLATPQTLPIHGKVVVVDGRVAYLVGSVFAQEYFDGRRHAVDEPRRGHLRWRSSVRAPVHDVSLRVEGPAVADLDATVRLHWDAARPSRATPSAASYAPPRPAVPPPPSPPPGRTELQVTRTLHGARRYPGLPAGETGIYESYLRALESAEDFVYLENQYLTCPELVDALVRAMRRAPALQLVLLTNLRPDVPYYTGWQRRALERLLAGLGEHRTRAGVYTLWSHERAPGVERTRLIRTHVHSKVAIVDDAWFTVGSANLDSLSLSHGQHELHRPMPVRLARLLRGASGGDPWQARATEVNVSCRDGEAAARLRRDLWAEHLGLPSPDDPRLTAPRASAGNGAGDGEGAGNGGGGGWLALWRERAALKLAGLRAPDPEVTEPRVLPYPHRDGRLPDGSHREHAHLRALGIDPEPIDVLTRFRSFSFRQGAWKP